MAKTGKFIFGAVIGAVATALLTPIAGKKARQKLQKTAKKSGIDKKKVDEAIAQIIRKGEKTVLKAKDIIENNKTKTKSK